MTADGQSYALAKEASLKIKETSYISTTSAILENLCTDMLLFSIIKMPFLFIS